MIKIEKHLFIFYISQIITIFIVNLFLSDLNFGGLIGFLMKLITFSLFSLILFFAVFAFLAIKFCGVNYYTKKNIESEDLIFTSSAIVTAFLLNDLLNIFNSISKDATIPYILTIVVGIPIIFFVVYHINAFLGKSLYRI
jgi:hypothetical protein